MAHCAAGGVADTAVRFGPWSGAVSSNSATVKLCLDSADTSVRLALSTNLNLVPRQFVGPTSTNESTVAILTFELHDLSPNTQYYFALEVNRRWAMDRRGMFRTFPMGRSSFQFAFGSCARTGSDHTVFKTIRANNPLFFMNVGDFHYENITNNHGASYRAACERVLRSETQAFLYRFVPLVYIWDDHDFCGNDSDWYSPSSKAARLVYQEFIPHYPLPAGEGDVPIYQAFTVGRARFILTDLRSMRHPSKDPDGAGKTMMGLAQKAWFKQELLAAAKKYPLIFWVSSVPWNGRYGVNHYPLPENFAGYAHHRRFPNEVKWAIYRDSQASRSSHQDHWSAYAQERQELADFLKQNGIHNLAILHGDAHMLAADNGTHSDFATGGGAPIPVMAAGALDQSASAKGGPYSQGIYLPRKDEGCFGLVTVNDLGGRIDVVYSGRNHQNLEKISLRFQVPGSGY